MGDQVFLNGQIMPIAEAKVSVTDRGFIFGDGVYEVIPFYAHIGFRLSAHVKRLVRSLAAVRIASPYTEQEWIEQIQRFSAQHADADQSIYLQVTRGPAPIRNLAFPDSPHPTVYMFSEPLMTPGKEKVENGISAVTADDFRWSRCDIKSISLLGSVLLRQYAIDCGAAEALLLREGYLTEGSSSNIFIVKEGVLYAPPTDHCILAGITYEVIIELATANAIPLQIGMISKEALFSADEIWLTSSTREVLAITTLDNKPIGNGRPGPVFTRMYAYYQHFKQQVMRQGEQYGRPH